jgi:hypothetical protein
MNKFLVLTAGSAGLILAAGGSMAAVPGTGGFGQFTSTAGTITGCVAGATCTTMVSSNGFLQQKVDVTAGLGTGSSYYRTIILDNNATATDGAGYAALGFRNESFVPAGGSAGGGDVAADGFVKLAAPTGVATAGSGGTGSTTLLGTVVPVNSTEAILLHGIFGGTGTASEMVAGTSEVKGIKILQNNDFNYDTDASGATFADSSGGVGSSGINDAASNRSINFAFLSDGTFSQPNQADRSNYMRLDEYANGAFQGTMTVRRTSGEFTVANDNGAGSGVLVDQGGDTLAYSAGDDIAVTLLSNPGLGGGTFGYPTGDPANTTLTTVGSAGSNNNIVQTQSFRNYTTGGYIAAVNDNYRELPTNGGVIGGGDVGNDSSGTGYMQTLFIPQNTTSVAAQWDAANWDPNFGSAPVMMYVNSAGTGQVNPASMSAAFPQ